MAKRQAPNGQTRAERRETWVHSVGQATRALTDAPFNDPTFRAQYGRTLRLLLADATGTSSPEAIASVGELVLLLHHFVQSADWDIADSLLGVQMTYDVARKGGATEAEALAAARVFRPDRWHIASGNPAQLLDDGEHSGEVLPQYGLTPPQLDQVRRFQNDWLVEQPATGRPKGSRSWTCENFHDDYRNAVARLNGRGDKTTDEAIWTEMGWPETTFKNYKDDYCGRPPE